jgi:XTP/dITP diphosphohydrolase
MSTTLLVATTNPGKAEEYRAMLAALPYRLATLREAGVTQEVDETADTIFENAVLKARGYARLSGLLTLADDSGLEVDALDGEPGVRSARYAGPGATDEQRNALVLSRMQGIPDHHRTARFRCVIAVATPEGRVETSEGVCEGNVASAPRGTLGFGYDPIFRLAGDTRHIAELSMDEKNRVSHRGKAMEGAKAILARMATSATSL